MSFASAQDDMRVQSWRMAFDRSDVVALTPFGSSSGTTSLRLYIQIVLPCVWCPVLQCHGCRFITNTKGHTKMFDLPSMRHMMSWSQNKERLCFSSVGSCQSLVRNAPQWNMGITPLWLAVQKGGGALGMVLLASEYWRRQQSVLEWGLHWTCDSGLQFQGQPQEVTIQTFKTQLMTAQRTGEGHIATNKQRKLYISNICTQNTQMFHCASYKTSA